MNTIDICMLNLNLGLPGSRACDETHSRTLLAQALRLAFTRFSNGTKSKFAIEMANPERDGALPRLKAA